MRRRRRGGGEEEEADEQEDELGEDGRWEETHDLCAGMTVSRCCAHKLDLGNQR